MELETRYELRKKKITNIAGSIKKEIGE
jgi:hypothetical protein